MKKIFSVIACLTAMFAFGEDDGSVTIGQVGVTQITSTHKNTIIVASYGDLASDEGISISNLVKTTNLTAGDQLALFSGTRGQYETWVLTEDAQGGKYWAKNEKVFSVNGDGKILTETGKSASSVKVPVGVGLWLIRNGSYEEGTSFTFEIYGKPSTTTSYEISEGCNLIGNPTQESKTIVDQIVPTKDDQILIPVDGAAGLRLYRYNQTKKAWYYMKGASRDYESPTVAPGTGFWYNTQSSNSFDWSK